MAMVNIDLARIPAVVSNAIRTCESCEVLRKPRAWICDYHSGYWDGYEAARENGSGTPAHEDALDVAIDDHMQAELGALTETPRGLASGSKGER